MTLIKDRSINDEPDQEIDVELLGYLEAANVALPNLFPNPKKEVANAIESAKKGEAEQLKEVERKRSQEGGRGGGGVEGGSQVSEGKRGDEGRGRVEGEGESRSGGGGGRRRRGREMQRWRREREKRRRPAAVLLLQLHRPLRHLPPVRVPPVQARLFPFKLSCGCMSCA